METETEQNKIMNNTQKSKGDNSPNINGNKNKVNVKGNKNLIIGFILTILAGVIVALIKSTCFSE